MELGDEMIKQLPGWANYVVLWAIYFALGWGLKAITGFEADIRFIALFTAFYCGAYLAKWRFYDGGWHFN